MRRVPPDGVGAIVPPSSHTGIRDALRDHRWPAPMRWKVSGTSAWMISPHVVECSVQCVNSDAIVVPALRLSWAAGAGSVSTTPNRTSERLAALWPSMRAVIPAELRKPSSERSTTSPADAWEFENGKARRGWLYVDLPALMAQLPRLDRTADLTAAMGRDGDRADTRRKCCAALGLG